MKNALKFNTLVLAIAISLGASATAYAADDPTLSKDLVLLSPDSTSHLTVNAINTPPSSQINSRILYHPLGATKDTGFNNRQIGISPFSSNISNPVQR